MRTFQGFLALAGSNPILMHTHTDSYHNTSPSYPAGSPGPACRLHSFSFGSHSTVHQLLVTQDLLPAAKPVVASNHSGKDKHPRVWATLPCPTKRCPNDTTLLPNGASDTRGEVTRRPSPLGWKYRGQGPSKSNSRSGLSGFLGGSLKTWNNAEKAVGRSVSAGIERGNDF